MLQSRDILNQIRDNFDVKHFPLLYNNYVSLHTKHTVTFCRKKYTNLYTMLCYEFYDAFYNHSDANNDTRTHGAFLTACHLPTNRSNQSHPAHHETS